MRWRIEKCWMWLWLGRDPERQIAAALDWISEVVGEDDTVLVDFPAYQRFFHFEFPLKIGDPPKMGGKTDADHVTFIIRGPNPSREEQDETWITIFSSPAVEIFEKKSRVTGIPPLRWGLTNEEKQAALGIARKALLHFFQTGAGADRGEFSNIGPRFSLAVDLDVALWVGGKLRGSFVVENRPLWKGIAEAAQAAARDVRFKPLGPGELERTRIEVTLIRSPRMPLAKRLRYENQILPEKGYRLTQGTAVGWYLPEVFNLRRFQTLDDFLKELAREKAGIPAAAARKAEVSIFEVDDFIESSDRRRALALWGPVVQQEDSGFRIQDSGSRMRMAADWLCRIQEPDGNIPPIVDPFGASRPQADWPRTAFAAWALAEFGKAAGGDRYLEAAASAFSYLKHFLLESPLPLSPYSYHLSLAYLGELAITLGDRRAAAACGSRILPEASKLQFEPILFAQIASFFAEHAKFDQGYLPPAVRSAEISLAEFEKAQKCGSEMFPAQWAELANSFAKLFPLTNHEPHREVSERITDWLERQRLPNGAFPGTTKGGAPYTRGTAKIFEVLAKTRWPQSRASTEKILEWLAAMQYDEETAFFIPEIMRPQIVGGFRHDNLNQEAWNDAAAHFILGGATLLKTLSSVNAQPADGAPLQLPHGAGLTAQ